MERHRSKDIASHSPARHQPVEPVPQHRPASPAVKQQPPQEEKQPAPMDVEMEEVKEQPKNEEPSQPVEEKKRMSSCVVVVKNLSRKVNKEHLMEIFGEYGTISKANVLPFDMRASVNSTKGYVDYEREEDAEKAVKHYSGGQIDGKVVICEVHDINKQEQPSGERGRYTSITTDKDGGGGMGLQARSPPRRHRQISPPRRSPTGRIGRGVTGGNRIPLGGRYHGGR